MAENDPQGLYSALGVQPSATAEQIRAAYRKLAKETHPDTSGNSSAERFHRISAAYEILSDPIRRARYDGSAREAQRQETPRQEAPKQEAKARKQQAKAPTIEPICCSRCGQVTAQPRSVTFFRLYSFLIDYFRQPIQGIFCARCARREGLKSSFITLLVGWWSRRGLIHSVGAILTNGFGGKREPAVDQGLLWHNAQAFLSRGNLQLAYALAVQASVGSDRYVAKDAAELVAKLEKAGADSWQGRLKDPWRVSVLSAAGHILMAFSVPGIVVAFMYAAIIDDRANNRHSHAAASQTSVVTEALPSSVNTCASPPSNGELLGRSRLATAVGHILLINNGSSDDAIVKVKDVSTGEVAAAAFVSGKKTASISGIWDGIYKIQYAFGDRLDSTCRNFIEIKDARQFPGTASLRVEFTPKGIVSQSLSQTLSYSIGVLPASSVAHEHISALEFGRQ
ncbi:hypothetical protein FHT87_003953 [Rhizobium sp. BK316]|uniref:J domain-containing protein n=1 Tax=Rhizobium sp. BK316 TaxID=2587053 RepID=UPI00160A0A6C|nr:J domain-containing protein [Rhizobium sp. BK316]MBB3410021.1 hypothetical protein [Rhizobium sp. BK316]